MVYTLIMHLYTLIYAECGDVDLLGTVYESFQRFNNPPSPAILVTATGPLAHLLVVLRSFFGRSSSTPASTNDGCTLRTGPAGPAGCLVELHVQKTPSSKAHEILRTSGNWQFNKHRWPCFLPTQQKR